MAPFLLQAQPFVPGRVKGPLRFGAAAATRDGIVVIRQDELVTFDGPCSALAVIGGKPFSHTMIRLLGYAIPTIILTPEQASRLPAETEMVLDGQRGLLFEAQLLEQYPPLAIEPPALFAPLITFDGERVFLRASAANRMDVMRALSCGASAIGLLHMEYLGEKSKVTPNAEFFANELDNCCQQAEPLPVTARLPDISADKLPNWCKSLTLNFDHNQTRGTRAYDQEPFKTLLDDILSGVAHCTEYYDLRLMLPYIDSVENFIHWRDRVKAKLSAMVAIGAMIETVSAARQVKELIAAADFIAIGSNDLSSDLLGCARDSERMNPYDPAIYRLLQEIAMQAGQRVREIQLDGQLARMPGVMPVLIGLGYRVFCLAPLLLPYLGAVIKQTDTHKAAELARRVCQARDTAEVKALLGV